jgi:pimeloyl-ACP methyl ester carboxylesterase
MQCWQAGERGDPVLLLHGGGVDSARLSWKLLIDPLAAAHRVYAPDWPGHGESEPLDDGAYTLQRLVDILGGAMTALGLQQASLAGISLGGGVALGFALQHPERVRRLVLADSYGLQRAAPGGALGWMLVKIDWLNQLSWRLMGGSRGLVRWTFRSFMHDAGAVTDDLVDEAMELLRRPDAGRAWRAFQRNEIMPRGLRTCYMDRLGELAMPVLIAHGQHDTLVPLACAREAHARIAHSQLRLLPTGHWPMREQPEAFNRIVMEFLAAPDPAPAGAGGE